MRYNIGYKVVYRNSRNRLYSTNAASYSNLPACVKLEYGVGKETVPSVGKLFVFKTLEDAKDYARISASHTILKGILKNPVPNKLGMVLSDSGFKKCSKVEKFWATGDAGDYWESWMPPSKTYFSESFYGLKEIK